MRTPPLLADFTHIRVCKPFCENSLTLPTYDWAQFNKEHQYLQRQVDWSPYVDWVSAQDLELPVEDAESLSNNVKWGKRKGYSQGNSLFLIQVC